MRITKYGHACLFIEERDVKILIDPGAFSRGFEDIEALDGILITHQHQDHMVPDTLKDLRAQSPDLHIYADEDSVSVLLQAGISAQVVKQGEKFQIKDVDVEVIGVDHAVIHHDIPRITNVGYLVAHRLFVPGDSLTLIGKPVEVLALPIGGPWLKVSEVIDYIKAVKPHIAIPVHDGVLTMPDMHINMIRQVIGDSIEIRPVPNGSSTEV